MTPKEQLLQEVETLPLELVSQALHFIYSLKINIPEREQGLDAAEQKAELVRSLRGKYAHLQTSSDKFAQSKQEAIDWEDRNR
jgi:hypothetical protein